uniref:Uncharacterized protein n=1 Tax=Piliocolobus tephrosceles TaxID=591936 RepID=A0A8C9LK29_9PRIM
MHNSFHSKNTLIWSIPRNTLLTRHLLCFLLNRTYHSRCKLRLNYPLSPRQWRLYILHLPIPARRPRLILWLILPPRNLKHRHYTPTHNHSNSLHGLRISMRTNIILRCHSNYKFIIGNPIYRNYSCSMGLRQVLYRQPNPHMILHPSFCPTLYYHNLHSPTPTFPT